MDVQSWFLDHGRPIVAQVCTRVPTSVLRRCAVLRRAVAVKPSVGTGFAAFGTKTLIVTVFPAVMSSASTPATSSIWPPLGHPFYTLRRRGRNSEQDGSNQQQRASHEGAPLV